MYKKDMGEGSLGGGLTVVSMQNNEAQCHYNSVALLLIEPPEQGIVNNWKTRRLG